MTDKLKDDGVIDPNAGGESGKEIKEDKAFLAIKEEKKALTAQLAAAKLEIEKRDNEAKSKQEADLKKQGEFEKLYEEEKKATLELKESLRKREEKELTLKKIDAVMQELGAPLAKAEYWNLVDISKVKADETTGEVDVSTAKILAADITKNFSELLAKKTPGKMPNDAPKSGQAITKEEWKKLPLDEKRKRLKDVKK